MMVMAEPADSNGNAAAPRERIGAVYAPRGSGEAKPPRRRRFVQFMKFVLPLLAVVLVGVMLAWPRLTGRDGGFKISFSSVSTQEMALVMNNPKFRGSDAKGQPYVVTADRAIQDSTDSKQVTLDRITADMLLQDGGWVSLTANSGLYHDVAKLLTLHGDVSVFGDRGFEFHGNVVEVDLNTSIVASDDKVWGHNAMGQIRANGLRVYDKGQRIVFINGVKTTLLPRRRAG